MAGSAEPWQKVKGPREKVETEKAGTGERKGKKLVTLFDFLCLREQAMGSILGVL